jgi:hypothetical protein
MIKRFLTSALALMVVGAWSLSCGDSSHRPITLSIAQDSPRGPIFFRCDPVSGVSCGNDINSIWLDTEGERGWAVGEHGVILRYEGGKWTRDGIASLASGGRDLRALWLDANGERGWAVGDFGVMLHYKGEKWTRDKAASAITGGRPLYALRLDARGEQGWAFAAGRLILRYEDGKWMLYEPASNEVSAAGTGVHDLASIGEVHALWLDAQGKRGWAVGDHGKILRYEGGKWTRDEVAILKNRSVRLEALWLDANGERGWAVGDGGVMLRCEGGKWAFDEAASNEVSAAGGNDLHALWLDANGERGWAVGRGVILRYEGGKWTRDEAASLESGGNYLEELWLAANGERGWAFGHGKILRYESGKWTLDQDVSNKATSATSPGHLVASWFDKNGERGWAVGDGVILRYEGGKWTRDEAASLESEGRDLQALWMDAKGERGWAAGADGVILHYEGGKWTLDEAASTTGGVDSIRALGLDARGAKGWAVGGRQAVLRYEGGKWTRDEAASASSRGAYLSGLWLDTNGERGWAVGDGGVMLRYEGGKWTRDGIASLASGGNNLTALWLDAKGERGWAVGDRGVMLRYEGGKWTRDEAASASTSGADLRALWLDARGERGWAIGEINPIFHGKEVTLHYEAGKWTPDEAASRAGGGAYINGLWFDANGERGWAVGGNGVVLAATLAPAGTAEVDSNVKDFSGRAKLRFEGIRPLADSVRLTILDSSGATLVPSENQYFTLRREETNTGEVYVVSFSSKAQEIANRAKGQPFQLRVVANFGDALSPTEVTFLPDNTLYVQGTFWLQPYIYGLVLILSINLALVGGAVFSPWARRLALDPNVRALLGVGLFKYILTEPLLVYVPAIRKLLFRDYRRLLRTHPQLSWWDEHEYVVPRISSRGLVLEGEAWEHPGSSPARLTENARVAGQRPDTRSEGGAIATLLQSLIANTDSKKQIWLIVGQSGLGKSAFLQQIARAALDRGLTPLLLPLGSGQPPEEEVATLISDYGDLKVATTTAADIVEGGGFILLVDALNEDRHPEATLNFLRKARRRNIILVSSQFSPSWPTTIPVTLIELAPFGREQLGKVLPEGWVDRVLDAPYLSGVAGLPITSFLLGAYITRHADLPPSDFAIYSSLREQLSPNDSMTLDQRAWEMFMVNGQLFKSDDRLTEELCEFAVRSSILTRRSVGDQVNYRFVHERVQRFFVACYLERGDDLDFAKLHKKLDPRFGRVYWSDVIEFLGEAQANARQPIVQRTSAYSSLIRKAGKFAPEVFADRLYPQYQRYRDAGVLATDAALQDWAARFLADLVTGKLRDQTNPL